MTNLSRLQRYESLLKYEQLVKENLRALERLDNVYAECEKLGIPVYSEKVSIIGNVEIAEQLSSKLILPLKVKGVFLTEGRPLKKYYTALQLEQSTKNPINFKFPVKFDHREKEVGAIVGGVDRIIFDPKVPTSEGLKAGVRYFAHINDETFARNILDKLITEVSATIYSVGRYTQQYGLVGENLTYAELSLIDEGQEKNNFIEVDE